MKLQRKYALVILVILISTLFLWMVNSGKSAFTKELGIPSIPSGIEIEEYYFSGIGMDHYYLWKINTASEPTIINLISEIGAVPVNQRSTSGCLGLAQDQVPDWWPANKLEDALWDYTDSEYAIYKKEVSHNETICIFKAPKNSSSYIQWFDT